ncbi:MAG: glycoside hydrolase family 3 C-terminal domain-containing protein [Lachnospiraceae bacterium]|nr:glycoside hydrolase family 3 C-terminal domain-containing protein [Lachnospiraceae bacterium]
MGKYTLDQQQYAALARQAAAEGCVLLKNENETLPLRKGDKVAVFGRIAFHYYKSGLGSGGLVNTRYVVSILDALEKETDITLEENLLGTYREWIKKHPYDEGKGWGLVPWSQEEMPVSDEVIEAAKDADVALIVIGRTAGEDQDNKNAPGSYLLTDTERELVEQVTKAFKRTAVLLNVGNVIDMKWVEECQVPAVLYVWQGGQEGGNGVADVLTGRVAPCGKLTDTIARNIEDYPSNDCFGDLKSNTYKEDIYVGYRYFETFAKEKVLYPFGFGLSYTRFTIDARVAEEKEQSTVLRAVVKNIGEVPGKEVVQVYVKAPQGVLGKPERVLAGFVKTAVLQPGEETTLTIEVPSEVYASYDDGGATGHKSCYVLEEGSYEFYVGADVRSASLAGCCQKEFTMIEQLDEAMAPVEPFARMHPKEENGKLLPGEEAAPLRTVDPGERMRKELKEPLEYTGDQGYVLGDVVDGKITLDEFIAQLSDDDLICLFRGEGMCSPKVTPGTAAAFGGLTDSLRKFGIPALCCTDGPSGLRFDCGTKAFSLPNGTLLGCTFNLALVEELYQMTGKELRRNRVDALLGPGMNIHRHPLNGRNFEYISEDPYLTGWMSAAQILGMEASGVTGTAKHFCANNQESERSNVNAVVSERALREIYLKGFEIAVKNGKCRSVMTTYGPVNGIWTAGSYDLIAQILRNEWGFEGIVMTDWWAKSNFEGKPASQKTHAPMVAAGNDVYMVTADAADMSQDDVKECLKNGTITRGDLQRNAAHILKFAMGVPAMQYELGRISEEELSENQSDDDNEFDASAIKNNAADGKTGEIVIDTTDWDTSKGSTIVVAIKADPSKMGPYDLIMEMKSDLEELAQIPVTISYDNAVKHVVSIRGTSGAWITETRDMGVIFGPHHYLKFYFGANGMELGKVVLRPREERD